MGCDMSENKTDSLSSFNYYFTRFHSGFPSGTNINTQLPSRQTPGVQSQEGTQFQDTKNTLLLSNLPPPGVSAHTETAQAPTEFSQDLQECLVQTRMSLSGIFPTIVNKIHGRGLPNV